MFIGHLHHKAALVVFSLLACFQPGFGQEVQNNQIIVYGTAEVKALADRAQLDFSVIEYGHTLREAADKVRDKVREINDALIATGLTEKDLSTSRFHSGENTGKKAFLSSKKNYRAVITIAVTIDDLTMLEPVLYILSDSEVETLSDVFFSMRDDASFKNEARALAIAKARDKAVAMTGQLGVSLGAVNLIEELSPPRPEPYRRRLRSDLTPFNVSLYTPLGGFGDDVYATSGIIPGMISNTAKVRLVFQLDQ